MATDNTQLNAGNGGDTIRDFADAGGTKWPSAVLCYATTVSAGANVLQPVMPGFPLPVTGTLTVNAGTNLNTSALALESGGHLASVDTKTPALGQALAAASVPVVLTAAQLATLTPLSTVGVTGTFWQATQPVSGTITVNAGTNLNTSALALEAGGHLAAIDGKVPALGQALAAASVPVVLTAAQLTTLTPVSTVTIGAGSAVMGHVIVDSGTITAVTAITNALPAGANLLGQVSATNETSTVFNGTTALTPTFAAISASSSGANTIVTATGGKRIRVLRWSITANGAVNAKWQTSTGPTDLTGLRYMTQFASAGGAYCPVGCFQTGVGDSLILNLSGAVAVGGELTYILV
jgi:hypothetical protein